MPRLRTEYGGCSVRKRISPRAAATACASAMSSGGNVEQPNTRILLQRAASRAARMVASRRAFLDVGGRVRPVQLVKVDPVGAQPPQAVFGRAGDPAPDAPAQRRRSRWGSAPSSRPRRRGAPAVQNARSARFRRLLLRRSRPCR